jgi:hypothetical protein
MRSYLPLLAAAALLGLSAGPAPADVILTINPDLSVSSSGDTSSSQIPGDDEFRVTVVNNSADVIQQLSLSTFFPGLNIFGLDNDGLPEGGGSGPGGYNSRTNTFTILDSTHGFVNFTGPTAFGVNGLAPGDSDFFALENEDAGTQPASVINAGVTGPDPTVVPEPTGFALLGAGGLALAGWRRWKRRVVER